MFRVAAAAFFFVALVPASAQERTAEQRIADLENQIKQLIQVNNDQNARLLQLQQTNNEQNKTLQVHDNILKYLHMTIAPARVSGISHWCAGLNPHACGLPICREAGFPSGKALTWVPATVNNVAGNTVTSAICQPPP